MFLIKTNFRYKESYVRGKSSFSSNRDMRRSILEILIDVSQPFCHLLY